VELSVGHRAVEHVMGLPVSVDVRRCGRDVGPALRGAFDWLRDVDARFSPFRPTSEVSRLDRGELAHHGADMTEVLALCAEYERRSGGAFRARLPGRGFDPSGIVKGWAVQRMADLLVADGLWHFCVNAGGDVVTRGEPEPGRPCGSVCGIPSWPTSSAPCSACGTVPWPPRRVTSGDSTLWTVAPADRRPDCSA
jgi:thiamine biosynthesis lipoprotein ApbE